MSIEAIQIDVTPVMESQKSAFLERALRLFGAAIILTTGSALILFVASNA